jgi:hypothetical protein
MYYNEPQQQMAGFGIKKIGKAVKKVAKGTVKVVKKVALPVAAVVAAPLTGGASLMAVLPAAGIAAGATLGTQALGKKKVKKAGVKQTQAQLQTVGLTLSKKEVKAAKSGKKEGSIAYASMNPAQWEEERARLNAMVAAGKDVKDANAKLAVLAKFQNLIPKTQSLAVGSSGTAVEIAVGSSPKTPPSQLPNTISDSLAVQPGDSPKVVNAKRKKAAKRLKSLQSGSSGAKAEAAALASQTGTTTEEALRTLIAQAQSAAGGSAPSGGGGGGSGYVPTQDSTANMLETAEGNTAPPASGNTMKYGLIGLGVAGLIYMATRKK